MNEDITWHCSVDECQRPKTSRAAKGMCGYHYNRTRPRKYTPGKPRECAIEGCTKTANQRICRSHRDAAWLADDSAPRCRADDCTVRARPDGWCNSHFNRIRKYGVTPQRFAALLSEQGGGCAVCGVLPSETAHPMVVDHDHGCCPSKSTCGRCVRGVLCRSCNVGIGNLRDDPALLYAAANYLTRTAK